MTTDFLTLWQLNAMMANTSICLLISISCTRVQKLPFLVEEYL
ncbi:hypothetical protein Hsw_4048 [Hymenobacter swuensis DY53]|uniref:Uncharacterized protein n=1 Tax=Hymenobacter swuensis DY53 TaxID=1227739 RepID=W8F3U4_9BACT|nr:hypothetical protein Hsw_4048 [Hymenobacter swuensis DY53]